MANINASIYSNLQAPDLVGGVERGLKLSDMITQRQDQRMEKERQSKMQEILGQGMSVDPQTGQASLNPSTISQLAGVAKPDELLQLSSVVEQQRKAQMAEAEMKINKGLNLAQAVLTSSEAEKLYPAARAQLLALGLSPNEVPEKYDKGALSLLVNKGLSIKDQIANYNKQQEMALEKQYKQSQIAKNYADVQKTKSEISTQPAIKPTKGQEKVDAEYAKDYNEWTSTGASALQKNLDRLEKAKNLIIQEGGGTSGRIRGRLPDVLRSESNIKIEQDVRAAAQGALRATLGPQFTQKEGEDIMKRSYDPTLSPQANIEKIDAAIKELKQNAANNEAKKQYYEKYGTLQGFKAPTNASMSLDEKPQVIYQNGFEYKLNPQTGEYE